MPEPSTAPSGAELLAETSRRLEATERAIRSHRFLGALAAGEAPRGALRALAGEQRLIVASDRRSFAQLAARFPQTPAVEFFLGMAAGEGEALDRLTAFEAWLELGEDELDGYEPLPAAQAYPAFVAWMALNGSRADVVLAFLANLAAWGENCGRVRDALRDAYGADDDAVAFFDFFATPPPDFEAGALAVLDAGLAGGEDPRRAQRATRLLQAYELGFWDAIADVPR